MAPFFLLALLSVSSLLSSPSAFPIPAGIPQPLLEPPPLPLPEQKPELPASPVSSPTVSPVAADQPTVQQQQQQQPTPSGVSEQSPASPGLAPAVSPGGGANHQPSGGLVQDQQQQLDASVSGGNAQDLPASPVSPVAADQPAMQQQQQQPTPSGVSEQSPALPGLAPAVLPGGGANQQSSGGLVQDQQQPLDASVSGGNAHEQEPDHAGTGIQPSGGAAQGQDEQGQLQPTGAGVQPIGFGQGQQQQALGFGAQPLVDNTPYDSGSSRMEWSLFARAYGLALLLFMM